MKKQSDELNRLKKILTTSVEHNNNKEIVEDSVMKMDAQIRELENRMSKTRRRLRSIVLEWDDGVERKLNEIGEIRVGGLLDYKEKGKNGKLGWKHIDLANIPANAPLRYVTNIAIDPQTENVFICDGNCHRVFVFNKLFEPLYQFSAYMLNPVCICIHKGKVYVTQWGIHCINVYNTKGKMLQSVGKFGQGKLEFERPMGIAISTESIVYICDNFNFRIQCLNLDLEFDSFIPEIFRPRDVKLTQKEILVLKRGNPYVCIFNYSHYLIREIIQCGNGSHLFKPLYFCLDTEHNILMTDVGTHCVSIFSHGGHLIHRFGRFGYKSGEFICPVGIALNSDNIIIVASDNPNHRIQLF